VKNLWQDVRYGLRSLKKSPGFALLVILTLGLGIGANTAIFSVVYGVSLRPLPYPQSDRIIQLSISYNGQLDYSGFTAREFDFWKAHSEPAEYFAATTSVGFNLSGGNQPPDVLRMIIGQGMLVALIGLAVGLAGALTVTRLLSDSLYGVKPTDPLALTFVMALLAAIAFLACYIPARRAAVVDPLVALRYE
jgi:FtsX-like permease family protein